MSIDVNNNAVPNYGDTVEWTIRYINDGAGTITNFQITDSLDTLPTTPPGTNRLAYVPNSITVTVNGVSTSAAANAGYNPNSVISMLEPGAQLAPGGMITVKIRTVVQGYGTILNQATGTGTEITTPVLTDTTDQSSSGTVSGYPVACAGTCLAQNAYSTGGNQDPTGIDLSTAPTAAPARIAGLVTDANGRGLAREQLILQNASTGEIRSATTNSFGRFVFEAVPTGNFYVVQIMSKRYRFDTSSYSFDLVENVSDVTFTAVRPRFEGPLGKSDVFLKGKKL